MFYTGTKDQAYALAHENAMRRHYDEEQAADYDSLDDAVISLLSEVEDLAYTLNNNCWNDSLKSELNSILSKFSRVQSALNITEIKVNQELEMFDKD